MENKDNCETQDPQQNFHNFKCFLEALKEKSAGNLKVNQSNFNLKMKLPVYKDCAQILSLYDNTFIKSAHSNSKKKSGTILIIWTILKFTEIHKTIVDRFSDNDWIYLASLFPKFSQEKIKMRWLSAQKSVEQKFAWSEEEDRVLSNLIKEILVHSNEKNLKWTEIAEKYNKMFPNSDIIRLGKHCRERWFNHLDPTIKKGDWTALEDIRLLELINVNGRKWSQIAKMLGSRNENSVKNRFFSLLNKFKKKKNIENDHESIASILKSLKEMNPSSISNNMIKKISLVNDQNKKTPKTSKTAKMRKVKIEESFLEQEVNEEDEEEEEKNKEKEEEKDEQEEEEEEQEEKKVLPSRNTRASRRQHRTSYLDRKMSSLSLDEKKTRKKIKIEEKKETVTDQMSSHSEIFSKKNATVPQESERTIPQAQSFLNVMNQQPQLNNFHFPSQNMFFTPEMQMQMRGFGMPPYPPPNFMPNQFTPYPYMYYQMPIMDAINEEMARGSMPFFPGFPSNNDIDLKNISHMVSSMSLTDEYLLEGQKMLSDLTFKSNSLSSMQDRLSFIIPPHSSNKSNSSLSKPLFSPVSLQLKPQGFKNNAPKKLTTICTHPANNEFVINKNQRKSTYHCESVRNNLAGLEHLEEVDTLKTINQQQPTNSFDKFLKNYSEEQLPSISFEFKPDEKPIPSLNHLE